MKYVTEFFFLDLTDWKIAATAAAQNVNFGLVRAIESRPRKNCVSRWFRKKV